MRRNKILHRLRKGEPVMLACPTPYPSPKLIEMIGLIGFDGVWIDMEHQDYDYDQLFAMGLACRASGMDPLVRMRKGPYWSYFRCLEAGANGIMVPHVCSAAEARDVVRNSRFHPVGQRGMDGVEVASNYGMEAMPEYMASANEETLVSIQIEDREGVEAIDEILAVEGLDGIMVGPADLTQSYGVPTQGGHPLIVQAVDRVAEAAAVTASGGAFQWRVRRRPSPTTRREPGSSSVGRPSSFCSRDIPGSGRNSPRPSAPDRCSVPGPLLTARGKSRHGIRPSLHRARTALLSAHILPVCSLRCTLSGGRRTGLGARGTFTTDC